jgi:ADP-ribose pyrophosphatase YjhB (NUDIX family)
MKKVIAAGGVVWRRRGKSAEIALIKDPYGKYALPKGHVERGESVSAAAGRETREETGLKKIGNGRYLGRMHFYFRDRRGRDARKGDLVRKTVHYYLFESGTGEKAQPQAEEKISEVKWTVRKRVVAAAGYKNIIPILKKAVKAITNKKSSAK